MFGKIVSLVMYYVTFWKDQSWANYIGLDHKKYRLIGSDPLNDEIIFDLAGLKNANTRHILYEQLGIPLNLRNNYALTLSDYMIKDKDAQKLVEIFESLAVLIRSLRFVIINSNLLIRDFKPADTEFLSRNRTIS